MEYIWPKLEKNFESYLYYFLFIGQKLQNKVFLLYWSSFFVFKLFFLGYQWIAAIPLGSNMNNLDNMIHSICSVDLSVSFEKSNSIQRKGSEEHSPFCYAFIHRAREIKLLQFTLFWESYNILTLILLCTHTTKIS